MKTTVKNKKARSLSSTLSNAIFIVDDDNLYCHSLAFYLKSHFDYEIYCYSSGEKCLEHIDHLPKIIILDYYLNSMGTGAMNGLETLVQLKKKAPQTKVVILSGQETLKVATDALKLGAYTYVIKDAQTLASLTKIIHELK